MQIKESIRRGKLGLGTNTAVKKCPSLTASTKWALMDLAQLCYLQDLFIPRKTHVTTLLGSYAAFVL